MQVDPNDWQNLTANLIAAISDGGENAFTAVRSIASDSRDLEVLSPAFVSLAAWGERGFRAIADIAQRSGSSKKMSAAMKIFSGVAATGHLSGQILFTDKGIIDAADARMTEHSSDLARRTLGQLILAADEGDLLIPLGVAFQQLAFAGPHQAHELVTALSARWLRFGPSALNAFENLIKSSPKDESKFQAFFREYPQFLDPMAVQVWSLADFHGALEPDFVIRRADNSYLIVEIECPGKKIVTARPQLSADVTFAEKQVTDYVNFLVQRPREAEKFFPKFRHPDALVVVGLEKHLKPSQSATLENANAARSRLKIVGFDWLLDRAKAMVENFSYGGIEVSERDRMI